MDSSDTTNFEISKPLFEKWEKKLQNQHTEYTKFVSNDISIDQIELLPSNKMKIILNDVIRTRTKDRDQFQNFEELLLKLLAHYCKINNVDYKQGMNEIMGPFLLMKNKINISISQIINIFSCFIDNFLTNYYYDSELYAFRSSVSLLTLLLRYHDPALFNIFEESLISPQMYATNWLLTTYASKHRLDIVYELWNTLIDENDQLFIHFIIIAFLKHHRDIFIKSDYPSIPLLFSKIKIRNKPQLNQIIEIAKNIRDTTLYSFRILVNKLEIFRPRSTRLKELYESYNTEEMISLPILPSELLYNNYVNEIGCPDNQ